MPLKILLADDSMTAQKMGKDILTGAGYVVIAVSNGAAAAKKLAEKPDIIILDIFMPGYSGLEICEKVRANADTAKTPVLLTVGKMEPYKPEDGQRVGADGVIIKPFEATDLLAAVQKLVQKAAAKAAAPPAYEKTMVFQAPNIKAPDIEEFKDPSYADWKSAEADEPPPPPKMQMSSEAGAAPAFMMDQEPAPSAAPSSGFGMDFTVGAPVESSPESRHQVEFTSASKDGNTEIEREAGLEHTNVPDTPGKYTLPAQDPALVTDPTELATAFVTKFGVEGEPEIIEVEKGFGDSHLSAPGEWEGPDSKSDALEARVADAVSGVRNDEAPTAAAPAEVEEEIKAVEEVATAPEEVHAAPEKVEEPVASSWRKPKPKKGDTQKIPAQPEVIVETSGKLADSQLPPEGMQDAALVEQMHAAVADMPVETSPAAEEAAVESMPPASAASPFTAGKPDMELANALAAAVGAESAQAMPSAADGAASASGFDASVTASVVNKVLQRMLPAIMVEVAKELDSAKKPK